MFALWFIVTDLYNYMYVYVCNLNHEVILFYTEKASISNTDAKRRNIATSAKILGTIDRAEPMDVEIASVTSLASTNQTKGATNTSLNLRREPLQKTAGGKPVKGTLPYICTCVAENFHVMKFFTKPT